ncbi:hypothetical protein HYH03_008611 [Edaphochlamys debaryana]|uniref:Radical SAM core domain-containing protein n=1 Tax=Edaphochlamys debaryana TaxID=47281 RepID=A0A835Y310_9CHLO|nr:hypothetical protein HYH03_008611 [Edaphochlamys debaryana]|eukprot:KAG2493191.1 hypothetical protein HYH03_008611 [Edaphochlamys debaryana]
MRSMLRPSGPSARSLPSRRGLSAALPQAVRSRRQAPRRRVLATAAPVAPPAAAPSRSPSAPAPTSSSSSAAAAALVASLPVPLSFEHRPNLRDARGRLMLKNLTLPELEEWCAAVGESPRRGKQLYRSLYRRWIRNLDEEDSAAQAFSAAFKAKVAASASLAGGLQLQSVATARDGTRKLVFALVAEGEEGGPEGEGPSTSDASSSAAVASSSSSTALARGTVETVLIPMAGRADGRTRYTACLSTQVGCAMNCQFCYTGRMGLLGNLSTAQIVEQVVEARRLLAAEGVDIPIANIVFMGMGEPLHNYDAVMAAIEILATGLELSRNKIIVSTVGLVPEMQRFIASKVAKLAVSLHATTDEVRDYIVPTNRRYPLEQLLGALRAAFPYATRKGDDFVVIEYVLLAGVNDTREDAVRLLELTKDIYCLVNLIVFNPHEGTDFQRSAEEDVRAFRSVFLEAGRPCTLRASKGDDEMAACGQLGDPGLAPRLAPRLRPPQALAARLAGAGAGKEGAGAGAAVDKQAEGCAC